MRSAPGSVLVVSSAPEVAEPIRLALLRLGLPSVIASSSADAVRRLGSDAPRAILVDLLFEEMDPEQIVHRALVCRETHGSPVIVLGDDSTDRELLLERGCSAVLPRGADARDIAHEVLSRLGS